MGDPVQLKDEGNKHFQAGEFDKAVECYSDAIKVCADKKLLAVIHRNRSACYLKKVSCWLKHHKGKANIKFVRDQSMVSVFPEGKLHECSIRCV